MKRPSSDGCLAAILLVPIFGLAPAASAQTPADVADLVGARGAGGETQLQARGYRFVRTVTGDDRKWSNWWHPQRRRCLSVATMDGRYASIVVAPAPDCGERADAAGHGGRDEGRHPDIGYRPPAPQRGDGSYATPGAAGGGFVDVGGRRIDLGLVCFGDSQRPGVANSYGWTWDGREDRYVYGNRVEMDTERFDASVMIQLWGDGGRIKLPKKLIPPVHSRGDGAWWDLSDVSVQPDRIDGRYRLNGLNKPRLTIDRRSGRITITGLSSYGFRGTCDVIDGRDHRRF